MTDYAKKTVADLQEILKSRSLPHTGKKAELVARLQEDDASSANGAETATEPAAPETVEAIPAQEPTLSKPIDPVDAPAVPAPPAPATDPDTSTNAVPSSETAGPGETATTTKDTSAFTANLASTDLQSELEKRKARAARFGAPVEDVTEAERVAQRAQRFGVSGQNGDSTGVKGLDEALPEKRERKAGPRGGGRGGFSRGGGGGGGGRDRKRGTTPRIGERGQIQKQQSTGTTPFASEKDRLAAEARRKRFAAQA